MNDTPETDAIAEMAHNLVLDWDCRDRGDTTEKPVVVPAEFARRLERERDQLRDAVKWVLGETGDFGPRPKGVGAYWWRKELLQRVGISEPNKTTKNE
jgi:hypothetical protein